MTDIRAHKRDLDTMSRQLEVVQAAAEQAQQDLAMEHKSLNWGIDGPARRLIEAPTRELARAFAQQRLAGMQTALAHAVAVKAEIDKVKGEFVVSGAGLVGQGLDDDADSSDDDSDDDDSDDDDSDDE